MKPKSPPKKVERPKSEKKLAKTTQDVLKRVKEAQSTDSNQ